MLSPCGRGRRACLAPVVPVSRDIVSGPLLGAGAKSGSGQWRATRVIGSNTERLCRQARCAHGGAALRLRLGSSRRRSGVVHSMFLCCNRAMDESGSPTAQPQCPAWLDPALIRLLADQARADAASGVGRPEQRAFETARALRPALPAPQIREAVAIALWVAGIEPRRDLPTSTGRRPHCLPSAAWLATTHPGPGR